MKDKQGGAIWDDSGWTDHVWKDKDGTPKQKNGWDCGLFMLKTADLLVSPKRARRRRAGSTTLAHTLH